MSHLTERALGLHAIDPNLVSAADRTHLAACDDCRRALAELRLFEDALRDPETWIGLSPAAPSPRTAELRAFAVRLAAEDEEAVVLLEDFREPSAAARFMWDDVASRPEYQTGGVARLLCQWAHTMCERDPLYALKLAEAATSIAMTLPDASYPRNTIHDLRGEALKEQANALRFLGRLPEALRAAELAEAEYRRLPHENLGLASIHYVLGCIHYEQDGLDAAEQAAHEAADAALRLGADEQYLNAQYLLGHVLFDRHDYAAAAGIFETILRQGQSSGTTAWIARGSLAAGGCYVELGKLVQADRYLHEALRLFISLDAGLDVTRTQWAIGRLLFAQGNAPEAIHRLRRCLTELTAYHAITDAGLVAIDLAEILNAAGRMRQVPQVLANVVTTFMNAGKLTSALTALAYLKEAANQGTMTPHLLAYVRRFVERADREPDRLFAPPLSEPL